jgi:serine/threonine protein kinase
VDATNLCMGCMSDTGGAPVCPFCHWKEGTRADSPLYLNPRTVLKEQYLVGRVLGHGGFGITYIGWDLYLARKIAVKEYFPAGIAIRATGTANVSAYSGNMQRDYQWGLDRYLEEARVLARFDHPNISAVLNFFPANGTAYMILDYLDGMTFEKFLDRRGGTAPWDTVVQIIVPVMDALREVHKVNILHRDISPDNIYILKTGQIKVIDFGAARYALGQQSRNLSIILKEGYAPEEQYRSKGNQGPWTDVYATGATMYRALTGKIPPPSLDRQRTDELEPPSKLGLALPPGKEGVLLQALAVQAEDRYQDMADFENAVLAATPVFEPPPPPHPPAPWPPQGGGPANPPGPRRVTYSENAPILQPLPSGDVVPVMQPEQGGYGAAAALSQPWVDAGPMNGPAIDGMPVVQPAYDTPVPRPSPVPPPKPFPKWLIGLGGVVLLVVAIVAFVLTSDRPVIKSFTADPASIQAGGTATLSWSVSRSGDYPIEIVNVGQVDPEGTHQVQPTSTTVYTLTAISKSGKSVSKAVTVTVTGAPPPPAAAKPEIVSFQAAPGSIKAGEKTLISWSVKNASEVTIGGQRVPNEGQAEVSPKQSVSYQLIAKSADGSTVDQTLNVLVTPAGTGLQIIGFLFEPSVIQPGQTTHLRWSVRGATSVEIQGLGRVPATGDRIVRVPRSLTATLVATGGGRTAREQASITVLPAQAPQTPQTATTEFRVVDFGVTPETISPGQPTLLHWSVVGAASVTIVPMPGRVGPSGQVRIAPGTSTRYELIAANERGQQVTSFATVNVLQTQSNSPWNARTPNQPQTAGGLSWNVFHDHDGFFTININRNQQQQPWHYCQGTLSIVGNHLRYVSPQFPAHDFDVPLSQTEVKTIRRTIRGYRAFEVKIDGGGHYNFVSPQANVDSIVAAINGARR